MNSKRRLEQILGYGFSNNGEPREYTVVDGVIYVDVFDGDVTLPFNAKHRKAFNGRKNGMDYWNEIHLDTNKHNGKTVELNLAWGSCEFDSDVQSLLDWLEENPASDSLDDTGISSKKIEDFSVSFRDSSEKQADFNTTLENGYGFYIRRPLLVSVSSEQKDASRYF